MNDCAVCTGARRAFEALARETLAAAIPLPRERDLIVILIGNAREKLNLALGDHDGHLARAARARTA